MYIHPQEYLTQLADRIKELKAELAEIEPVYLALKEACKKPSGELESGTAMGLVFEYAPDSGEAPKPGKEVSVAEKISKAQFERHKKERAAKVPVLKSCIRKYGPQSLRSFANKTKMSAGAVKKVVEEYTDVFVKNAQNLWDLK